MAGYTLYFVMAETPTTWCVLSQDYETIDSPEPILGSDTVVSRNLTQTEAENKAAALQRESYGKRRQEQARGNM